MKHIAKKGFTLIELAVVIAIIAILAAVAIPRFADTTTSAELSVLRNLKSQLVSSAAMFTARVGTPPAGFNDYVTNTQALTGNQTLTTFAMDDKSANKPGPSDSCTTIGAGTMTCTTSRWSATYTYVPATGVITATATGQGPNAGQSINPL
jgi:prepilin-type N-terminal cleavage/methylation domain-containing protein